ncbi:2,5-dihydroxypyridine 5,6-dioxygenase [Conexibacter stalactiti]|uniref:2,5-dihydroxypyridine 5,6-dioxygenase n=1 Tax=Conexibacter stalactiti TaxID=1940611 RepID=A0ABU4HQP6_9ACTN|nr:2,5-dihydroxypyridine 5,6-dioxygenase [Conexibacter stalactiti]MDW5595027.1 2,5-dihydroxypyridine 5,6-dioxygenase [Conexibacter stalactiti]MEC5035669.1 2,5-dihydroxypyridine 5,6-dioxygenase [Conexibacter stalactiti]
MPVPTFTDLCREELALCGIGEGDTIAVLSQGANRTAYVDAFLAAAEQLGAVGFNVRLPHVDSSLDGEVGAWQVGATPLAGNRPAIEALKRVDLVVDTIFLLFSREQKEIQEAGVKVLLCIEPIEHLRQMAPTRRLRERVEAGAELLGAARELRFTNRHGSDVTYRLGTYPVITQYGYTDTPGRWDHWPSGFLFTGGADDGVDGTVVIAPGDIVFPFKSYVQTPIELTIEAGRIVRIDGALDADLLRAYMEGFDDPNAYGISHIGWGMLETARWETLAADRRGMGMHGRSFYGNVLFSTGPNGELGGPNETLCHVDVPMRNCSLFLDGRPIVVDGDIVVDELKVTA